MDLNGDGYLDVTSGRYSPGRIYVWWGGAQGFSEREILPERTPFDEAENSEDRNVRMKYAMATANFADFDGDGDLDFVCGNVSSAVYLCINHGSKTAPDFGERERLTCEGEPLSVGAKKPDPMLVDWDLDGKLDLLVGTEAGDVLFFRGRGGRDFSKPVSAFTGESRDGMTYKETKEARKRAGIELGYRLRIDVADWNRDGLPDLLVGNCYEDEQEETRGVVRVFLRRAEAETR